MTPDEIQRTIEGMLQVQQELQVSQVNLQQELIELKDSQTVFQQSLQTLAELYKSGERKLERLIGYSITQESDILDVKEEIAALKVRIRSLEKEVGHEQ